MKWALNDYICLLAVLQQYILAGTNWKAIYKLVNFDLISLDNSLSNIHYLGLNPLFVKLFIILMMLELSSDEVFFFIGSTNIELVS